MSLQNVSLYEGMVFLWDRKRNGSTINGNIAVGKSLKMTFDVIKTFSCT